MYVGSLQLGFLNTLPARVGGVYLLPSLLVRSDLNRSLGGILRAHIMNRKFIRTILALSATAFSSHAFAQTSPLPVFPGAVGFGTTTVAGSGRGTSPPNATIYGWGGTSNWNTANISDLDNFDVGTYLDVIGNVYRAGSNGLATAYGIYSENTPSGTRLFLSDNIAPQVTNVQSQYRALARVLSGPTPILASLTFENILAQAGSRPWDRNADDLRVISGVRGKTLRLRDAVGTWPTYVKNSRPVTVIADPSTEADLDAAMPLIETN